jgi:hypothetical protein
MTGFWGRNSDGTHGDNQPPLPLSKQREKLIDTYRASLPQQTTMMKQGDWSVVRVSLSGVVHFEVVWNGTALFLVTLGADAIRFGINVDRQVVPTWLFLYLAAVVAAETALPTEAEEVKPDELFQCTSHCDDPDGGIRVRCFGAMGHNGTHAGKNALGVTCCWEHF